MSEDEAAENNLVDAIERVNDLAWETARQRSLWRSLYRIAELLNLEIIKVELPGKPDGSSAPSTTGKGDDNGK